MINETELLNLAIANIRKVLDFNPYNSYKDKGVENREQFQQLIANDPAFAALGLDDERYIIARVGGNLVTSLHRKIGDMYEALFGYLLKKSFDRLPDIQSQILEYFYERSLNYYKLLTQIEIAVRS